MPDPSAPGAGWVAALRCVLVVMGLSTVNGVVIALADRPAFLAAFPGATGPVLASLVGASLIGLFCLAGLWRWQGWARWAFGVVGIAICGLDMVARGPMLHLLAAAVSTLLVLGLTYPVRARFKGGSR